jgi:hypothetical protein
MSRFHVAVLEPEEEFDEDVNLLVAQVRAAGSIGCYSLPTIGTTPPEVRKWSASPPVLRKPQVVTAVVQSKPATVFPNEPAERLRAEYMRSWELRRQRAEEQAREVYEQQEIAGRAWATRRIAHLQHVAVLMREQAKTWEAEMAEIYLSQIRSQYP